MATGIFRPLPLPNHLLQTLFAHPGDTLTLEPSVLLHVLQIIVNSKYMATFIRFNHAHEMCSFENPISNMDRAAIRLVWCTA